MKQIPKSEVRSPKEIRNPKAETAARWTLFRISKFVLPSDFGFRDSDLFVVRT